ARGIDTEQDEVGLPALAYGDSQILATERDATGHAFARVLLTCSGLQGLDEMQGPGVAEARADPPARARLRSAAMPGGAFAHTVDLEELGTVRGARADDRRRVVGARRLLRWPLGGIVCRRRLTGLARLVGCVAVVSAALVGPPVRWHG